MDEANIKIIDSKENKLKVLWLCYFSNKEVQDQLKPWKRIGEFAPWISSMITLFENDQDIELHVVSQHEWIPGYKHFVNKGVKYYFINKGIPLIGRHWPGFFRFDVWTDLFLTKKIISGIVKKVNPDIIHMQGTENLFCTSVIQFHKKYPVFITIQGFIHKSLNSNKVEIVRAKKELEILKMFRHYGYRTKTMGEDILSLNSDAVLHWHKYPMKTIIPVNTSKKFDLVFFARVCKEKGIEDLLRAVSIIKKDKPDISLCVIGGGKSESFEKLAVDLGIAENVTWAGFLPTQEDVHKLVSGARISVLPTYHDIISGTIIESLFLKIPVVAYNVGGIHEVNEKEEIISLVEKQNIKALAETIDFLLDNPDIREIRSEKGYKRAQEMFNYSDVEIRDSLLSSYEDVIKDFNR
jgi:glycosyltransferase involved in cell wall biosynthesis